MLQVPLMSVVFQVRALEEAVGAARRIADLFAERPTVPDGPFPLAGTPGGMQVEFDGVGYHYRADHPALSDVSVRLPAGQRLAVVGRTGAGKSTLAKLLFRFADPTAGRVLFDGRDLRELTVDSVRSRVGMVPQDVQVFHASVRDNVTLFDPDVPDELVATAVRDVGLGEWLADLPDGLDTTLGAGATGLSAGEAQLLAFSRVLIADPGLVVLDEAASRLDPAARRRFDAALRPLLAGRTAVIIAHGLDAVRDADLVVVLDGGRVVEQGPPAALADDPGSALSRLLVPAR
jgi:ATP-binding cassette subfamily B protein